MEGGLPFPSNSTSAGATAPPRDGREPSGGHPQHVVMMGATAPPRDGREPSGSHPQHVVMMEMGGGLAGEPAGQVIILEMADAQQVLPRRLLSRREALEGLCGSGSHARLLQEWQHEEEVARRNMHRKDKNVGAAHSEVYQLLALFSLVQGGLFAALAQSSSLLSCALWWCPFALSLTVTAGTLAALHQRLRALAGLREELRQWSCHAEVLFTCIGELKDQGAQFDLSAVPELPATEQSTFLAAVYPADPADGLPFPPVRRRLSWEVVYTSDAAIFFTVVVISLIVLYACRRILCNPCHCH